MDCNIVLLLIALFVCHYLADFCLTMPMMIRAKADGKNLWPILLHASIHVALMVCCLWFYGVEVKLLGVLMALELFSHFIIDTLKAKLSVKYPRLADPHKKSYWMLYGLDQLLHQLVVMAIWYMAVTH